MTLKEKESGEKEIWDSANAKRWNGKKSTIEGVQRAKKVYMVMDDEGVQFFNSIFLLFIFSCV